MTKSLAWKAVLLSLPLALARPRQSPANPFVSRADDFNPWDPTRIKSYLALGDSFAAGIGVGNKRSEEDAGRCSRYDGAYPMKVQAAINAPLFRFPACSGDVTKDVIEKQLPGLPASEKYDLVTVSIGGNDVGFSTILKQCVFLPDMGCKNALADAETTINNYIPGRVEKVLQTIDPKVSDGGEILWTLYPRFFSLSPSPCNKQKWCFIGSFCNTLTVELRTEMNRLTDALDQKIFDQIEIWNRLKKGKKATAVNPGGYTSLLNGQFCEADSANNVDDPSNDKMAFIRPFDVGKHDDLKRRDPVAHAEVEAWRRGISGLIPDSILKFFHPNDLGTYYQAMTVIEGLVTAGLSLHPELAGAEYPTCPFVPDPENDDQPSTPSDPVPDPSDPSSTTPSSTREDLSCVAPSQSPGAYIAVEEMEAAMNEFCEKEVGGRSAGDFSKSYNEDTYGGSRMFVKTNHVITTDECKQKMNRIIHGCVPAKNNPSNMKYGGELDRDDSHFKIDISGTRSRNRRFGQDNAPLQTAIAHCDCFYQGFRTEVWIYGSGFVSADGGEKLKGQLSHCIGSTPTDWSFIYYDQPDKDGYEWKAFGHTPIWQGNCFSPVIHGSGGPDVPCMKGSIGAC